MPNIYDGAKKLKSKIVKKFYQLYIFPEKLYPKY